MNLRLFLFFVILFLAIPVLMGFFTGFPTIKISPYLTIYSNSDMAKGCVNTCNGDRYKISCFKQLEIESCNYICLWNFSESCP